MAVRVDEAALDRIFAPYDQVVGPGAAVGVSVGGRPVYRRAFGLASLELPVVLSPSIRMRIASVSKHFTCLAWLLLCEGGWAGLDDQIGDHLPELSPRARGVSVRQLMGHVSGLRDVFDIGWFFSGPGRMVSSAELLEAYSQLTDTNAQPGEAWSYSNGGYLLLSAAIERVTGKSLEDVFRELIFEPAGLHDTQLRRSDHGFLANSATLHTSAACGGFDRSYMGFDLAGEGGIVSTVDDMLRWLAHMDAPRVGSEAAWAEMATPLRLANGSSTGYALGLMIGDYRGVRTLGHSGMVMGGRSHMLKVPDAGLDVMVVTNRHDALAVDLANAVLDACLPDLEPTQEPAPRGAWGAFVSNSTGRVAQLLMREGKQFVSLDGSDMPVTRGADGSLHPTSSVGHLKRTVTLRGDASAPSELVLDDYGNRDVLQRQPIGRGGVDELIGSYWAASAPVDVKIIATPTALEMQTRGPYGSSRYVLEQVCSGVWRVKPQSAMPLGGVLVFDAKGGFSFSTPRTRHLAFEQRVSGS